MSHSLPDGTIQLDPPEQFGPALVGAARRSGEGPVAIYSTKKILQILVDDGLDYEEAVEHFEFNIAGSGGAGYPLYLMDEDVEGRFGR